MGQMLREVNAPYTVNADDEAIGRETIIIRRNGEPVAAVVPYAEYQQWQTRGTLPRAHTPRAVDPEFEKQWAAFQRLLPELLKEHRGKWVGIVNEQAVAFGPTSSIVLEQVIMRFGDVPMCVSQVLDKPRIYHSPSVRVVSPVSGVKP